jgi:putative membrane protein
MAVSKLRTKPDEERLIVLAIDIDNDLYRKTKISGPLMGRVQNLNGATQLALADPEDTDANAMFEAVKVYDEMKENGYDVNVATITGSENEGYTADREVARQLELVMKEYAPDACIFITDGESDRRVLPIIESRLKINSTRIVTVKQAEGLENTYFTVIEKLKEPHYARIIFGIPAMLFLLFSVSYLIGAGWEPPVALIGLYLMLKGFGLEDALIESSRGFGFSIDRISFVFYMSSMVFLLISVFISLSDFNLRTAGIGAGHVLAFAYAIEGFMLLLPIVLLLYLIGRILDVRSTRYMFRTLKYGTYIGSSIIFWVLLYSLVAWIIGQIYFGQFIYAALAAIAMGITVSYTTGFFRRRMLSKRKIKGKMVLNELGALIGKAADIDVKKGRFVINTSFGNAVNYSVDRIIEISENVVIK